MQPTAVAVTLADVVTVTYGRSGRDKDDAMELPVALIIEGAVATAMIKERRLTHLWLAASRSVEDL